MGMADIQLGDCHDGRAVKLTEINHSCYVEKPRSLFVDEICGAFLRWCGDHGSPYPITVPGILSQNGTKYAEFIAHEALRQIDDANRYYRNTGALLAFCYMLGSTDLHDENLIAAAVNPVIIDLETVLTAKVSGFLENDAIRRTGRYALEDSVLNTGLLPNRKNSTTGDSFDVGGISGDSEGDYSETKNLPFFQGKKLPAADYLDDICTGFEGTYQWILNNRKKILDDSPYCRFEDCTVRCILRQTQVYSRLLQRLSAPDMQENREKYEGLLSKLSLAFTKYANPSRLPKLMPIYESEAAAIRNGDIPYFTARADSLAICDGHGTVLCEDYFAVSAFERSKHILNHMSLSDLEYQTDLIRASFHAAYPEEQNIPAFPKRISKNLSLVEAAEEIYRNIRQCGKNDGDGTLIWPYQCGATEGMCGVKMAGPGLYNGRAGVALFFAALYAASGNLQAKKDAENLMTALFEELEGMACAHTLEKMSLGYADGLGGILVAIYEASKYLDHPEYSEKGLWLLHCLSPSWIDRDKSFDVLGGTAGLLLAVRCYPVPPAMVEYLADNILNHRTSFGEHQLIFHDNMEYYPLIGMGHGTSGIAAALLSAWEMTGKADYRNAALDMLAYERECFSSEQNNWPDYRYPPDPATKEHLFMHGWCSGAPGIAFSRIRMNKMDSTLCFDEDLKAAEQWTNTHSCLQFDHLCCGNATMIDYFVEFGKVDKARMLAGKVLERRQENGTYTLTTYQGKHVKDAGLFSGLAGIGYSFLRAEFPDVVRTIL